MRKVAITKATKSLAEFARDAAAGPVLVTDRGKPVTVLLPVDNADHETVSLSTNSRFMEMIERSRARQQREGGLSPEQVRRRLGLR